MDIAEHEQCFVKDKRIISLVWSLSSRCKRVIITILLSPLTDSFIHSYFHLIEGILSWEVSQVPIRVLSIEGCQNVLLQ